MTIISFLRSEFGLFLPMGSAMTDGQAERMMYMRLKQQIRVSVSRPNGGKETVLKPERASLRNRLLSRFVGERYAVQVLTPVEMITAQWKCRQI